MTHTTPTLDRLVIYAAELAASDPEAAALLQKLIAQAQAPRPRQGRVKTVQVFSKKNGAGMNVSQSWVDEALERERKHK